jgi:NADH-quinone oxidoreductase subunit C
LRSDAGGITIENENAWIDELQTRFPEGIVSVASRLGETTVEVKKGALLELARFLHDDADMKFALLSDLTCVDYLPQEPRFAVVYHLLSLEHRRRLRLRVRVPESQLELPSVTAIWPGADWYEREVYDLFGISFEGYPNLRRILMPDDWEGHPLRKDYPLGREEIAFTHNQEEVYARKRFAER